MATATAGSSPAARAYSRPIVPWSAGSSATICVTRSALQRCAARTARDRSSSGSLVPSAIARAQQNGLPLDQPVVLRQELFVPRDESARLVRELIGLPPNLGLSLRRFHQYAGLTDKAEVV